MPDAADLAAENARLASLVRALSVSASLQARRAQAEAGQAHLARTQMQMVRRSVFWRATAPMRLVIDLLLLRAPLGVELRPLLRRARQVAAEDGWLGAARRGMRWWSRRRPKQAKRSRAVAHGAPQSDEPKAALPLSQDAGAVLAPGVLIVAELTLPQCAKYRVWQKQEHFQRLGLACVVVDWRDGQAARTAAQLATMAILYRVPGYPLVLELIEEFRRLRVPTWWEVDDLIFDEAQYLQNQNLTTLDPRLRESILSGVPLYRAAMLACDRAIASTPHLAAAMRDCGVADVMVVENSLDEETLAVAAQVRQARETRLPGSRVLLTYGSGTKTHDADFAVAAPAIAELLSAHENLDLRVIGELNLPAAFGDFGLRVERLPATDYAAYLRLLGESDISIAPLENTRFNDAKSNIKFLEAAILGLPSVCSPRASFTAIIRHGENGWLADSIAEWRAGLESLIADAGLRRRIGQSALRSALDRYAPAEIAACQVAPMLPRTAPFVPGRLRVLAANIYYWPRSFGGATVVAEAMCKALAGRTDTDVSVVTTAEDLPAGEMTFRYEQDGIPIFALALPGPDAILPFDNPELGDRFGKILDAMRPDVVHFHSIQGLSAAVTRACQTRAIPYVITLHDAWYLCARQFMVRDDGHYCFQTRIDLSVCEACCPGLGHVRDRFAILREALHGAALLISPSETHRRLYLANGVAPARIRCLPNGVRGPQKPRTRRETGPLRFGYVGGAVAVKGYPLVRLAFETIERSDYRLVLVDNTLNLGFAAIDAAAWKVAGELVVMPAYSQETIDDFFDGIDVLLFPSQWKESFGLTVREAMLRDVWVIVTDGGGPAEAVREGENGNIIPLDGRADGLRAAIIQLLNNPERLRRYRNPFVGDIIGYEAQALALREMLVEVAHRRGPPASRAAAA